MPAFDFDRIVRAAAFRYLDTLTDHGEKPATWAELQNFTFEGRRIPLTSQQGIFKPAILELPISIRTAPPSSDGSRPYSDEITSDGFLVYRYRGTDPNHSDNRLLRIAGENAITLLYLQGIDKGLYAVHGAGIINDHPRELAFHVVLFPIDAVAIGAPAELAELAGAGSRRHYLAMIKKRADQAVFRTAVLNAYRTRCAICRLKRGELLDAAHIIPDSEGGESFVTNGLSLCKIHHAAYDYNLLGVRPDYVAEVRADLLDEKDGPMLKHGLQEVHGAPILLPRSAASLPDRDGLEVRYQRFREAS